ncbi:hypothetical protein EV714DRAFT_284564 [Schizophyllum commune]
MLRTYSKPSHIQIELINWLTFLLESELRSIPPDDTLTSKILNQLAINRSILAPIRRLPIELLSEIFFLVLEESPLRSLQAATTMSHVCRGWRNVTRELGALWTKVVVETLDDFEEYCERFLPMTNHLPLELRCDNPDIIWDLWDVMAPYASRWRRITLGARLSMLQDLKVLYMERLERLVIFAYDAPISPNFSVPDFVVAPRLRHIGLTLDVLQSERQLHVPVTQTLTSLRIEAMSPFPITYVLPLLRACAQTLQILTLTTRHPSNETEGSYSTGASDIFDMTFLTDLRINDSACALLNHIAAPLLKELVLSDVPAYGSRSLLGFLTRNQESRHLIDFRVYRTEERDIAVWIPCLRLMNSVRDLHFDELLSNADFLKLLTRRPNEPPLLPSLRKIAIFNIFFRHEELQEVIRDMCASRATMTTYCGHLAVLPLGWFKD